MFLGVHYAFDWSTLWPLVLLIGLGAFIPVLLSVLKLKFIPVFVVEIILGIIIAHIPQVSQLFFVDTNHGFEFNALSSGVYVIGMAVLLFLSGLDTDFSVLKPIMKKDKKTLNPFPLAWICIGLVVLVSFGLSFIFSSFLENRYLGIPLLTIAFASTFASLVIPLLHSQNIHNTTIGKIVCTYSTISELLSIVSLSAIMIIENGGKNIWLIAILIVILVLTYVFKKYLNFKSLKDKMEGIVFLGIRLMVFVFFVCVILSAQTGAEFILGAFLAGMIIKTTKVSHIAQETFEAIGYGIFVPVFYMLVGINVGTSLDFLSLDILGLILILFVILVASKVPFMILFKWYPGKTVIPTMFVASSTIIVALTCEHLGVFEDTFANALIVASALTCIIPPILFYLDKKYGTSRAKYDDIIIDPHDITN